MKVVILLILVALAYSCFAQKTEWLIPEGRTDSSELHKYVTHSLNLNEKQNRPLREVSIAGLPSLKQTLGRFLLLSINDTIRGYKVDSTEIARTEADSLARLLNSSKVKLEEHRVL